MNFEQGFGLPYWYAIRTRPMQEDRAARNLEAWQVEVFNPRLKERRCNEYTGKPTYLSKPLFTRYIFARFDAGRLLNKVSFTRGVHSVVGFGDGPTRVSDEVIGLIQSQVGEDGFVRIGEELKSGDPVVITGGPLRGLTGVFDRKMKAADRVKILLTTINYQGHILIEEGVVVNALSQAASRA